MSTTLFKKNVATKIKKSKVSPYKARKLQQAIIDIDEKPVEVLCKTGRAFKLNVGAQKDLYAYRVGMSGRIIFSSADGKKIVHDIVDTDSMGRSTVLGKKQG